MTYTAYICESDIYIYTSKFKGVPNEWLIWIQMRNARFLMNCWSNDDCSMCILHLLAVQHHWQGASSLGRRHGPPPLRSLLFPMGLKNISRKDRERVRLANRLYKLTWRYIKLLDSKGIGWSVENPSSSLMWVTEPFAELMRVLKGKFHGVLFIQLHVCLERRAKSRRPFGQTLRNSSNSADIAMTNMNTLHGGWPKMENLQQLLSVHTTQSSPLTGLKQYTNMHYGWGLSPPPETLDAVHDGHLQLLDRANKAILGTLPRGNKVPPLLTDFLQHKVITVSDYPFLGQAQIGARLADQFFSWRSSPPQAVEWPDGEGGAGTFLPRLEYQCRHWTTFNRRVSLCTRNWGMWSFLKVWKK